MTDSSGKGKNRADAKTKSPGAESDGTITINVGLWPVVGLIVVVGGLLFGVWLARGGLSGGAQDGTQSAQSPDGGLPGATEMAPAGEPGALAEPGDDSAADATAPTVVPVVVTASDEAEVLATLNGQEITSREIDLELIVQSAIRAQSGMSLNAEAGQIERFRREILEHVLDQRALVAAADGAGIVVTDLEATAGIPTMGSQLGVDGTSLYEAALAAGITDAEYLDWVRGQLAIERFLSSDEARQVSMAAMIERGVPADQVDVLPVDRESVAAQITADAEVVLIVDGQPITPVVIGEKAPEVELIGLDGEPFSLSDLQGKPVLLNFWATWCVPCRVEMPSLQRAHEQYGDDLTILGASVEEPAELVSEYADALGLTFPLALDPNADVARLFRVRAMPTTYIIDADGIVVEHHRGAVRSDEELAPILEPVLPSAQSMTR